jgi:hypothetical protein
LAPVLCATAIAVLTATAACASALAGPLVFLRAGLRPETLGASTTVSIGFQIHADTKALSPLRTFAVQLPLGIGFAASTLGVATCSEQELLARGVVACPRDSVMGSGHVVVQAPFGPQLLREIAPASLFMTQPVDGNTTLLFYFRGSAPVIAAFALQTQFVAPVGLPGFALEASIPEITTTPGGSAVSVLDLQANIGPRGLLYSRHVHGRTVTYHPVGLSVPESCPHGGFVFVGSFTFQDGSEVHSRSIVPCPRLADRSGS